MSQPRESQERVHPLAIVVAVMALVLAFRIILSPVETSVTLEQQIPVRSVKSTGERPSDTIKGVHSPALDSVLPVTIPNPLAGEEGQKADIRAVEVAISWEKDGPGHVVFTAYGFRESYLSIDFFSKFNGELDYVVTTGDFYFRTKHKPDKEWREKFEQVRNFASLMRKPK